MRRPHSRRSLRITTVLLTSGLAVTPSVASGAGEGWPITGAPKVVVVADSSAAYRLASWASGRFSAAGLELPPAELSFHDDDAGCGGNLGVADDGVVDLCVRLEMEPGPQRIVLHELAHVWEAATLDDECRRRFLELRHLDLWVGEAATWKQRGAEQAAEIVAWALGDGTMMPMIDGDREPEALSEGFDLLTSCRPA